MIEWLIEHYAEISVYGGIAGLAFLAIILIALFMSKKIEDLKSKRKRGMTDESKS